MADWERPIEALTSDGVKGVSKYGHVKYVDTSDYCDDFVEFTVSFCVRRDVALDFMDALIPHHDKEKRDPIGAILVYSDRMEDDA